MNRPYLVGITGGIGAGKSIISKIFRVFGTPVYDADTRAKWLMENNEELVNHIKNAFGAEAYKNGHLNRVYLAKKAFGDQEQLSVLNGLVHPAVATDFSSWSSNQNSNYVIKEAALLIESGSYKELDALVVVTAPEPLRLSRVLARDSHRTSGDVENIMAKQLQDTERIALADHVIHNDESTLITPQVKQLHQSFMTKK